MKNIYLGIQIIKISLNEIGQRLDNYLINKFKTIPKSKIYCIIRKGLLKINNKKQQHKYKLKYKDNITIPPLYYKKKINNKNKINLKKIFNLNKYIIYEDKYLIILNKPSGIAVHGGSKISFGIIELLRILRPKEKFLELVHRLDKETSGVLLIAKKRISLISLHKQIRNREIKKTYLSLVSGKWNFNINSINKPLIKIILKNKQHIVKINNFGKPSLTYFKIKKIFSFSTLLKIYPITGRTHQIRVHAKFAGHPIACDNLYGDKIFNLKLKKYGLNRLFLHAYSINFKHPNNKKNILIKAKLDIILKNIINKLL